MQDLQQEVLHMLQERGWNQLRPGDVAKSIILEGAELLELFQWDNPTLEEVKNDPERLAELKKELADVIICSLELAALLEIDTAAIIRSKLAKIAEKYPAELMRPSDPNVPANQLYWQIKKAHRRGEQVVSTQTESE